MHIRLKIFVLSINSAVPQKFIHGKSLLTFGMLGEMLKFLLTSLEWWAQIFLTARID